MKINYHYSKKYRLYCGILIAGLLFATKTTFSIIPGLTQPYRDRIKNSFVAHYAIYSMVAIKNWYTSGDQSKKQEEVPKRYTLTFTNDLFKRWSWFKSSNFFWLRHTKKDIDHNVPFAFNAPKQYHSALCIEPQQVSIEESIIPALGVESQLIRASIEPIENYLPLPEGIDSMLGNIPNTMSTVGTISAPLHQLKEDVIDDFGSCIKGRLVQPLAQIVKNIKKDLEFSHYGITVLYYKHYLIFGNDSTRQTKLFEGIRDDREGDLKNLVNNKINRRIDLELVSRVSGNYKEHLMPKSLEDYIFLIYSLINLVKNNKQFRESLSLFKVYTDVDFSLSSKEIAQQLQERSCDGIVPIIALYPATGKEHAQIVRNIIYENFGTMKGLNIAPCYNEKITSLIFGTQYNRDEKEKYKELFNSTRVYFNETFNGVPSYKYRLKNPRLEMLRKSYLQALSREMPDQIEKLIKKFEKMNFSLRCADELGNSLLDYAYSYNCKAAIDVLRAKGALRSKISPIKLLEKRDNQKLELLLQEECNWNAVDEPENSLFYYALKHGNVEAINLLGNNQRVRVNAKNKNYKTALEQFLLDIKTQALIPNQDHVDALAALLLLKPQIGRVQPIAEGTGSNSFDRQLMAKVKEYEEEARKNEEWSNEEQEWTQV